MKCETCIWREQVRQGNQLETSSICRGGPPTVHAIPVQGIGGMQLQMATIWPSVNPAVDYCARWEASLLSAPCM